MQLAGQWPQPAFISRRQGISCIVSGCWHKCGPALPSFRTKTWGWIPFVWLDKGMYWAPWQTDRKTLTDRKRVSPTAGGRPGSGYYNNPRRIILRIKGWLDSLGLSGQGIWLGLCQLTDERLVCSCVIWQLGCVQTALCCGDGITPESHCMCVCKPVAEREGMLWERPTPGWALSSECLCLCVCREF